MTGFQFGRKLGDWGKDEDPEAKASKVWSSVSYDPAFVTLGPVFVTLWARAHLSFLFE